MFLLDFLRSLFVQQMENGLLETKQEVKNMLEEEKDERAGQSQVKRWRNTAPPPQPLLTQEIIYVELAEGPGVARGKKVEFFFSL